MNEQRLKLVKNILRRSLEFYDICPEKLSGLFCEAPCILLKTCCNILFIYVYYLLLYYLLYYFIYVYYLYILFIYYLFMQSYYLLLSTINKKYIYGIQEKTFTLIYFDLYTYICIYVYISKWVKGNKEISLF